MTHTRCALAALLSIVLVPGLEAQAAPLPEHPRAAWKPVQVTFGGPHLAPFEWKLEGDLVALSAVESTNGVDLNGDGDQQDRVLVVHDLATGATLHTGMAVERIGELRERRLVFVVDEGDQGADQNGDGDALDQVLFFYDHAAAAMVNSGLAVGGFVRSRGKVAFEVPETAQGEDLDGNGMLAGAVLHLGDLETGAIENLMLGDVTLSPNTAALGEELFLFHRAESLAGDLNGDGDALDNVTQVRDLATGATEDLAVAGFAPRASGGFAALVVLESAQGNTDLNGDGDASDEVLHVYDNTGVGLVNVGLANSAPLSGGERYRFDGQLFVFLVHEPAQGNQDLDGNGSKAGRVLHALDLPDPAARNLGFAPFDGGFELSGGRAAFLLEEAFNGDLNGDGDDEDEVLHSVDAVSGAATNVGYAAWTIVGRYEGAGLQAVGDTLFFHVSEHLQGGVDLNGDGDGGDIVMARADARTGTFASLGFAVTRSSSVSKNGQLAWSVYEPAQGDQDLNGNGSTGDYVPLVHSLRTGRTSALPSTCAGSYPILSERRSHAFLLLESAEGMDLNGDGDQSDLVLRLARARL